MRTTNKSLWYEKTYHKLLAVISSHLNLYSTFFHRWKEN